jgi:hypothetical protein
MGRQAFVFGNLCSMGITTMHTRYCIQHTACLDRECKLCAGVGFMSSAEDGMGKHLGFYFLLARTITGYQRDVLAHVLFAS